MCATKLWENVSTETVGAILVCAETYNCPELKKKCIAFVAKEENLNKTVLTDGFLQLVQKFPSIIAEMREKFGASGHRGIRHTYHDTIDTNQHYIHNFRVLASQCTFLSS
jgi:hypothetical protein